MAHVYIACSTQGIDQLEIPSLSEVRILVNTLKILWLYMDSFDEGARSTARGLPLVMN